MKKQKKITKFLISAFIVTLIFSMFGTVFAAPDYLVDTTKTGSLTLTKYEQVSGSDTNTPLAGVTFTIYKVTEDVETPDAAETYITDNSVTGTEKTTGEDGTVKFEDLELGRYYVKETAYPENVVAPIESFLIDIPMTSEDGTKWIYDVVAQPKNQTVYGDVTLVKKDAKTTDLMAGVTFKLQKLTGTDTWTDYEINGSAEFTTSSEGTIAVENLSAGEYRFVETATLDGYILDQSASYEFEVLENQTEAIVIDVENEKVEVEKQVELSDGSYGDSVGAFATDTIEWKISVNVPTIIQKLDTYTITDETSENIVVDTDSIVISGVKAGTATTLATGVYTTDTTTANKIIWNFDTSKLVDSEGNALYDTITIEYQGTLTNLDDVYGTDIVNNATVEYTNVVNSDGSEGGTTTDEDTADVHTGEVLIHKTNSSSEALAGAEFKIATSEENAKNGVYVKDSDGNDLVATSDANGHVVFSGLKYGSDNQNAASGETSYWIVETKAPADYNLLKKPVEVKVNATSGNYDVAATVKVINKKGFELPQTGAMGAIMFTVAGLAIIIAAVVLTKKTKKSDVEK